MTSRECNICGKFYATNYSLLRHQETMHNHHHEDNDDQESLVSQYGAGYSDDETSHYDSDGDSDTLSSDSEDDDQKALENDTFFQSMKRKAFNTHEETMETLYDELGEMDHGKKIKSVKRAVLPKVRKSLRYMIERQLLRNARLRRSRIFKIIKETADHIQEKGYSREEALRRAIEKRKHLIYAAVSADDQETDDSDTETSSDGESEKEENSE